MAAVRQISGGKRYVTVGAVAGSRVGLRSGSQSWHNRVIQGNRAHGHTGALIFCYRKMAVCARCQSAQGKYIV